MYDIFYSIVNVPDPTFHVELSLSLFYFYFLPAITTATIYSEWAKDVWKLMDKTKEKKDGLEWVFADHTSHSERTVEGSPRVMVTAVVDRVSPTRPDIYTGGWNVGGRGRSAVVKCGHTHTHTAQQKKIKKKRATCIDSGVIITVIYSRLREIWVDAYRDRLGRSTEQIYQTNDNNKEKGPRRLG